MGRIRWHNTGAVYDRSWMLEARERVQITQADVARMAGTSLGNYNSIERGVTTPNIKVGFSICDVLKVNPRMFMTEQRIK